MIKNRNMRITTRDGKLTAGYAVPNPKGGRDIPHKADHWIFKNPETGEVYFPELLELFGDNCKTLLIKFPTKSFENFYDDAYNIWGGNNAKKTKCDGETLSVYYPIVCNGENIGIGEHDCYCVRHGLEQCSLQDESTKTPSRSMPDTTFKAYIYDPEIMESISPLAYRFFTRGYISGETVRSALESFQLQGGDFTKVLFEISVRWVKGNDKTFPVYDLKPYVDPTTIVRVAQAKRKKALNAKREETPETGTEPVVGGDTSFIPDEEPAEESSLVRIWRMKIEEAATPAEVNDINRKILEQKPLPDEKKILIQEINKRLKALGA